MNSRRPEGILSTAQIFDEVARGLRTPEEAVELFHRADLQDQEARRPRWMPRWLWAVLDPMVNTVLR